MSRFAGCWMAISKLFECCLIGCSECVILTGPVNESVFFTSLLEGVESGPPRFTEVSFHSFAVSVSSSVSDLRKTLTSRSRTSHPKTSLHLNPRLCHLTILNSIPYPVQEAESPWRALQPLNHPSLRPPSPNCPPTNHPAESPAPSATANSFSRAPPQ